MYNVRLSCFRDCDSATVSQFVKIIIQSNDEFKRKDESFLLFHNPVNNILKIKCHVEVKELEIIDSQGQVLQKINTVSVKTTSVDLSGFPDGIYFVKANKNGKSTTKKFIKH